VEHVARADEDHFELIVGAGDFFDDGKDEYLIENTAGALDAAEIVNGQAVYTRIASLGSEWKVVGTGDYLAEGHDQVLIENTVGAVEVGDWTNSQIHYAHVTGLGSEWTFRSAEGQGATAAIRSATASFAQAVAGFAADPAAFVGVHSSVNAPAIGAPHFVTAATSRL